jgi:hypothetical protein
MTGCAAASYQRDVHFVQVGQYMQLDGGGDLQLVAWGWCHWWHDWVRSSQLPARRALCAGGLQFEGQQLEFAPGGVFDDTAAFAAASCQCDMLFAQNCVEEEWLKEHMACLNAVRAGAHNSHVSG